MHFPDKGLVDTLAIEKRIADVLLKEYTREQIENPTEEQAEEIKRIIDKEAIRIGFDLLEKKSVWFMICEEYGKYYIAMYYDNEYNHSDGEDL